MMMMLMCSFFPRYATLISSDGRFCADTAMDVPANPPYGNLRGEVMGVHVVPSVYLRKYGSVLIEGAVGCRI